MQGADKYDLERADKYVEAVLVPGTDPRQAAREAGFSDKSKLVDIHRPGGPVDTALTRALEAKGITDEFLVNEYAKGIAKALEPGAVESVDCNAHAKYLLQLGYLKGYGRNGPSVAVQINNQQAPAGPSAPQEHDHASVAETLKRVESLLGLVQEVLGERHADGLHGADAPAAGGDQLHAAPGPHPGVGEAGGAV